MPLSQRWMRASEWAKWYCNTVSRICFYFDFVCLCSRYWVAPSTVLDCKFAVFGLFSWCSHPYRKGRGLYYIHKNLNSGSHFMHGESTVMYWQRLLTEAFDLRREKFNLEGKRGMLVADAFTGNFSKKEGSWDYSMYRTVLYSTALHSIAIENTTCWNLFDLLWHSDRSQFCDAICFSVPCTVRACMVAGVVDMLVQACRFCAGSGVKRWMLSFPPWLPEVGPPMANLRTRRCVSCAVAPSTTCV